MIRTDLALEACDGHAPHLKGLKQTTAQEGTARVTTIQILSDDAAQAVEKPRGTYITVEWDTEAEEDIHTALQKALFTLLPAEGTVLVAGLGNREITPDALGPQTAARVLATRHITAELAERIGLAGLRSVAVLTPGVLGQTGVESAELLAAAVKEIHPAAVLAVDALAARSPQRLCRSLQLCDSGISPGSGVANCRAELSQNTLGVPVVALGMPTVVDAEGETTVPLMLTPRDVDLQISRAAHWLGHAINCALQPRVDPHILQACV